MKLYNKVGALACGLALMALTSCAVNDQFADNLEIGQTIPTVSWELGSTVCKAGADVSFKGKYYTSEEHKISHSEVWASITRSESSSATARLTSALSYTKTVSANDTVRSSQMISSYPHSQAEWDGWEYVLSATFPTSRTLSPVAWTEPTTWDEEKFEAYYPAGFQDEFKATVVNYLTKDSTYIKDLQRVYVNYDFTADQFAALNTQFGKNFPTETALDKKSDLWFTDPTTVDHYYYITVVDSVTVSHEIQTKEEAPAGVSVYDVYKSSPWLFCRYSDDTGSAITAVRAEYMPMFKAMIELIPFTAWIYNTADKNYSVEFKRSYKLIPTFKVFDDAGKMGMDTDTKSVDLN